MRVLGQGAFLTTFCPFKGTFCRGATITLLSGFNEAVSTLGRIKKLRVQRTTLDPGTLEGLVLNIYTICAPSRIQ